VVVTGGAGFLGSRLARGFGNVTVGSYREILARGSLRGRMVLASARLSLSQLV